MITEMLLQNRYWILFVGLLIAGETVLLPGIYLTMTGVMELGPLIAVAISATWLSDSILYLVGRFIPLDRLQSKRKFTMIRNAAQNFSRQGVRYIFLSRFVYGTRSAVQVICGATHFPYGRYMAVNLAGAAIWLGLILGVALSAGKSLEAMEVQLCRIQIIFGILILFIFFFQRWIRKHYKHVWSPRSFPPTTNQPPSKV